MKKKSTKRRPKTKLKKYVYGGEEPIASASDQEQINRQNQRNSQQNYSQYMNYATTAANTVGQIEAANSNPNLTSAQRSQQQAEAAKSGIDSVASVATPWYGYASTASDMGKSLTGNNKTTNEILTPDHEHMINDIANENYVTLGLDSMGLGKFGRMALEMTGQGNKNGFLNKAFGTTNDKGEQASFPYGGTNGVPNAELEKQEVFQTPNGQINAVNGPSHEQGGVPVSIPAQTQILSDKLKLGKKTFAELGKPYITKKEDKVLADSKSNRTAKTTAQLIIDTKNAKTAELFQIQEQLKMSKVAKYAQKMGVTLPTGKPQMKYGGVLPSYAKYPNGGKSYQQELDEINAQYENTRYDTQRTEDESRANWFANTDNYDPTSGESERDAMKRFSSRYDREDIVPQTSMDPSNQNYSNPNIPYRDISENAGSFLGQNAGNIWDLYKSGFGNKYDKQDLYTYNPALLSDKEALRDADIQSRITRDRLKDMTNGNVGAYLSNLGSTQTANTLNKARIREQFQNINTGIKNQAKQANIAGRYAVDDINARNKARSEDMAAHAIRDIGSKSASSYKDYKEGEMNDKKMNLINQYFPNYKFDPNTYEMYYKAATSQTTKSKPKSKRVKSGTGYTAE